MNTGRTFRAVPRRLPAIVLVALLAAPAGPVRAGAAVVPGGAAPAGAAAVASPLTPPGAAAPLAGRPRDPAARGAPQRQPGRQPVAVVLARIDPKSPGPSSVITVTGEVVHQSRVTYNGMSVRLRYSPVPIAGRGALQAFAGGSTAVPDPTNVAVSRPLNPASLTPGSRRAWTLRASAKQLGLRAFGVYPITIDTVDAAGRVLGSQRTVLTYVPKGRAGVPKPTRIAWVWPVIDRPRRADDAAFLDDRLETELAQNGRLAGLVTAAGATNTPVTWAIDPALLDDARAMSARNGYALTSGRRPKSPAAERWLRDLKAASNNEDMFATPYADPDTVALVRAGMSKDLAFAALKAQEVVQNKELLSARILPGTVWPVSGYLDRETLEQLRASGAREVLVNSAGVPPLAATPAAASAASGTLTTSQGPVTALAADQVLGQVLAGATRRPGTSVVTEQRFLAETALIGAELPGAARTVIAVPPRRWSPEPELARSLLADTSAHPWLKPVSLREAVRADPVRRTLVYPQAAQRNELSRRHLAQVRKLHGGIERFVSTFEDPRANSLERGVARSESSALRGRSKTAKRVRTELGKALNGKLGKLRVLASTVSLAGRSGPVPVTIVNDLPDETVRVRLEVESQNTARLQIGEYTKLTEIGPNQKETVKINMRAVQNGVTSVTLRLETPDGKKLRQDTQLEVRTTAFGKVAITITGIALGVLFLGVGIRVIRRSRRRDAAETQEAPAEGSA